MSDKPLPYRPRLSEHGMLRRHLIDGVEKLILHDSHTHDAIELSSDQIEQLLGCDGTRDLGGVMLAASRADVYRRSSLIEGMLMELNQRALLADGIPPRQPLLATETTFEPGDRPLEVLPDYAFRCDGHGSCCTTYSSIPFSWNEAARGLRAVPEAADADTSNRFFLPLYGSAQGALCAVTMVDGGCAFLSEQGHCRVHAKAGPMEKPRACLNFPSAFAYDGHAVRVSVAVECACVVTSLSPPADGAEAMFEAPLVPEGATLSGELTAGTGVSVLPEQIQITPEDTAPREALRSWSHQIDEALRERAEIDAVAVFWSLADALEERGPIDGGRAVVEADVPVAAALGFRALALAGKAADKKESTANWRSERDRARRLSIWMDVAAQALTELPNLEKRLNDGPGSHARAEAFYVRSVNWGYQYLSHKLSVVQALRDRAMRVLLARQCALEIPQECADDAAVAHPLTAVEAMMRGQGLDAYAVGLR